MGRILSEIFRTCDNLTSEMDSFFERPEIKKYDYEIENKINEFTKKIDNTELQQELKKLFVEIEEINSIREMKIAQLYVVHGMALYIQLQNEILAI